MKYDFDKLTQRRGTACVKWDEAEDANVIPMWVADMDFETAPCIIEALQKRVSHGIFGYTLVPESYYEAIVNWFSRRHQWQIEPEWILYTTAVVPALSVVVKAMTEPGDKVLIQTPCYNCFFSSVVNNSCETSENPLIYKNERYEIDFDDFERRCADPAVKLFILCNPHNPAGRLWTKEEMMRMNEICKRHNVVVASDEIHCELTMPGQHYIPFASVSDECLNNSITMCSPSKAFNTAGLQIANIICNNREWRERLNRVINVNEVCDVNPFGVAGLQAAYNEGEEWLDQLRAYLYENYLTLRQFFKDKLPNLPVTQLEATYLVWVDIRPTGYSSDELTRKLLDEGKVMVNSGTMYGKTAGEGFIRINIACPKARMLEGLNRIAHVLAQ